MNSDILEKIIQEHKKDKEQLEVIESNEKRLIVEAPPGYGKTKTMISQIAYILASGKLPNPKKILVLTFSVNAAYKIKKDILDLYKEHAIEYHKLNRSIFITNYHGFCRRFLNLYGYLISERLKDINKFKTFDDSNTNSNTNCLTSIEGITDKMAEFVGEFNKKIKEANKEVIKSIQEYNEIVLKYIIPQNQLPFNAILTLTIEILKEKEKLKRFFHALYPIIMVDEFQDTNFLSLFLLCLLVGENTSLYLYGDPLQRIYGFIGAIPNLMERSMEHFKIEKKIEFKTNYRFRENKYMLDLEKTLRTAARNFKESKSINVEIYLAPNQQQEANYICELVKNLLKEQEAKIAVLVRKRDGNTNEIVNALKSQNIDFFYALYSEEDEDYKKFHEKILEIFEKELEKENYKLQKPMLNNIKRSYEITSHREEYLSLLELFELFWKEGVFGEYNFLETQDKINLIRNTLENYSLKNYLNYAKKRVVITTIHGSKGLEWDYVILPDMERYSLPARIGACGYCTSQNQCENKFKNDNFNSITNELLDEFSVFYVAVTRAKRMVFFTASEEGFNREGTIQKTSLSCFLHLPSFNLKIKRVGEQVG